MKRSPLLPIFLIVVVDVLGLTLILPLLAFYAEHLGASPQVATLLVSVYAACQLVSGPLLGRLSDVVGRKPLLLVSQLGTLIGFLILARAETLWLVFLSRIIDGSTAGNISLAQAYIADVTAPENRAKSFGLIGIAFGLGFLVGPLISAELFARVGYTGPIYAAAALSFTSILATALLLPSEPPSPTGKVEGTAANLAAPAPAPSGGRRVSILAWREYAQYFQRPELASLLAQFFCFMLAFSMFTSGIALFAERRFVWEGHPFGAREVGWVLGYSGFLGILWQGGLIGRLVRRFGEARLATAGFAAAALGYALLGPAFGIPLLLVSATAASFGTGVLRPTLTSLITQRVDRREQGSVLGLNQSLQSVAQIVAPTLGGWLINRQWLWAWAVAAGGFNLLGLIINRAARAKARGGSSPAATGPGL